MTNEQIQKRTKEVQDKIEWTKCIQALEPDVEIAKCWDGMIDDLELIIANLPVEGDEEEKPSVCEVEADPNTKEYQEQARQDLDDTNSFNRD